MQSFHGIQPVFDEDNLVSHTGLVPVLALAERAGLSELVREHSSVPSASRDVKARTVIAGMLAGADSIDDLDVLRAGSTARVIGEVRAPSTMGTFLRSFTHGHVLQLGAVNRRLLHGLADMVPGLVGGDDGSLVLVDLDDTIGEVHGYAKQDAAFGYSGVRGLNALLATISTPTTAPVIGEFSLRRGNARSGSGAHWFAARALATVARVAPGRRALVRGDSAFCSHDHVQAAIRAGAWYSFTIPKWPTVTSAIDAIAEDAWTPIEYPHAVADPDTGELISDAEVAETTFTAFVSRRKSERISCRLVVRRVKRLNTGGKTGQEPLFDTYRYHAFITNSTLSAVEADATHRRHAIVEQVIAELKNGPLAHLPLGRFHANAAWLGFATMAFNVSRAAAIAAGTPTARMATVLATTIAVPARLASRARRTIMHLPTNWPWRHAWARLWATATGPPSPATT
ncbi:IS1380 family transposase [Kocuria palustris]|uniref:IS1380 family transposase n=1 Tax=Kocuria palustris TaxID=71999 RepID=UPI003D70AE60